MPDIHPDIKNDRIFEPTLLKIVIKTNTVYICQDHVQTKHFQLTAPQPHLPPPHQLCNNNNKTGEPGSKPPALVIGRLMPAGPSWIWIRKTWWRNRSSFLTPRRFQMHRYDLLLVKLL